MTQQVNEYKGFSLFNDLADYGLRNRNRAVMLCNMASNHSKDQRITPQGASLILNYFNHVPQEDRADVRDRFMNEMKQRGFYLVRPEVRH